MSTVEIHGTDLREGQVVRYTLTERMCHWLSAISYVYLMLTGLALFTPYLYWLAYILGGGPTIRFWHPWVGVIFFAAQLWMQSLWHKDMKFSDADRRWNKMVKAYVTNHDEELPPAGHFNYGQKQFYWVMYYSAWILILTGLFMWFPESLPRSLHAFMPAVIFLHATAALVTIGAFMIHVYMGVAFVSGGMQGILWGHVPISWAKTHHRIWYEQIQHEDRRGISSASFKQGSR